MNNLIRFINESDIQRFERFVKKQSSNECWPWLGAVRDNGYGAFSLLRKSMKAHQVAAFIKKGWPPDNKPFTLHTCDNRICCNPSHLFYGTQGDNLRDAASKGRCSSQIGKTSGTRSGRAKLTADQVREIRSAQGFTRRQLASIYGVSHNSINAVVNGVSYTDVL